jgi:hypothetical protein
MAPTNGALAVEHEIQRLMLERLGIEWTPGEPFYSLVEAEIERLRAALQTHHDQQHFSIGPLCGICRQPMGACQEGGSEVEAS